MNAKKEEMVYNLILSRLGSPEEIAQAVERRAFFTPSNMKWVFILLNILFFGGGSLLTLAHNLYQWEWLSAFGIT